METNQTPKKPPALLAIISGPSGVGKGTVVNKLLEQNPDYRISVTATTRPPRVGEIESQHYFFFTEEEFCRHIEQGYFLEWAIIHNRYYGTIKENLLGLVEGGGIVILEVDIQGATSIRRAVRQGLLKGIRTIFIFLIPPSFEDLSARLRKRQTERRDDAEKRLLRAATELQEMSRFDHIVLNKDLLKAVREMQKIIKKASDKNV